VKPRFRERLIPGPGTVIAVLLLFPAIWIILLPLSPTLGLAGAILVTVAVEGLLFLRAPRLEVSDGVLAVGPARIPVSLTGDTAHYRKADAMQARGPGLDARAFTLFRGWVDPVARIDLTDPQDPTPYWLVSTRHPELLREAIAAERDATNGEHIASSSPPAANDSAVQPEPAEDAQEKHPSSPGPASPEAP
jgi:hypothetical protein